MKKIVGCMAGSPIFGNVSCLRYYAVFATNEEFITWKNI